MMTTGMWRLRGSPGTQHLVAIHARHLDVEQHRSRISAGYSAGRGV
jgi:hypothetical protein